METDCKHGVIVGHALRSHRGARAFMSKLPSRTWSFCASPWLSPPSHASREHARRKVSNMHFGYVVCDCAHVCVHPDVSLNKYGNTYSICVVERRNSRQQICTKVGEKSFFLFSCFFDIYAPTSKKAKPIIWR